MDQKKDGRLDRLEEALYSRDENRLPKTERSQIPLSEAVDVPEENAFSDTPLSELVSADKEHPHRKIFEKIFLVSLGFAAIALLFAGYRFFLGGPSVSEKNIDIIIAGPSIVPAATPLSLDVRVENRNARAIEDAVLKITYPRDARAVESRERVLESEELEIGSLGSGKSAGKQVSMVLYGEKDDVAVFSTRLEYHIPGSQATFVKESSFSLAIGSAPVILHVSMPTRVVAKQPFDMSISVESNSADTIGNVTLTAEYPFGFILDSSTPKPFTDDNVWRLGDMPTGNKKTIRMRGTLEAENDEERTFRFSVAVAGADRSATTQSEIASALSTVSVSRPFLSLSVGVPGGSTSAAPGDRIPVEINWTNNLSVPVTNAVVEASLSGVYDETSLAPQQGGFYNSQNRTISWSQSGNGDLASISPGERGRVRFTLAIPRTLPAGVQNQGASVHVIMRGVTVDQNVAGNVSSSADLSFKFRASPTGGGFATRSSAVFSQKGPIPPQANVETTYSVVLSAASSFADVRDASMTATLPQNVSWNNLISPGSERMTFDDRTRVLTWNIGNLAAGAGQRNATIGVFIIPSVSQIGAAPALLSNLTLQGTDSITGENISANLSDVTTDIPNDAGAVQNAGVVGE